MSAARSLLGPPTTRALLAVIQEQIDDGTAAKKCHGCGCFQQTVEALAGTEAGKTELALTLAKARATFVAKKYDCIGCAVCYPAVAANAFAEAFPGAGDVMDLCPTEAPAEREGWPPLPGDYQTVRYAAPVAVCVLNSTNLITTLSNAAPDVLAVVGTMHTENLGIERLIQNVVANPNIRFLILCGEDTQQAVGHLPGQALQSLIEHGVDEKGRIIGAKGKRPVIKNVAREVVDSFRRQIELVSLMGEQEPEKILAEVRRCGAESPGAFEGTLVAAKVTRIEAAEPRRLVPDPAGYFVVYPERRSQRLHLEHFTNAGVFTCVIEGTTPAAVYAEAVKRALISRLDHAAYLGRELARAEQALDSGEPYVQDRAAGEIMNQPEVTCTLQPIDRKTRVEEWRSLLERVVERTSVEGGVNVRFGPGVKGATVADLASREVECCSFFDFSLAISRSGLTLEVRAPAEGQAMLDELFGDPKPKASSCGCASSCGSRGAP